METFEVFDKSANINRNIYIFDKCIPPYSIVELYDFCIHAPYTLSNYDIFDDSGILAKKWKHDLSLENLNSYSLLEYIDNCFSEICKSKNKNIKLVYKRAYVNYADPYTIDSPHVDETLATLKQNSLEDKNIKLDNVESFTILIYPNTKWDIDWFGETKFYDMDVENVIFSFPPSPGKIIIFDGLIPHSASPPSLKAKQPRYTIAIKAFGAKI